ncbi:MAG: metallophosphoesterase, partial [Acidobacteriota bacterium]
MADSHSIKWLHLSDLHIRVPVGTGRQGDQKYVLDQLLHFVREQMPRLLKPDFIFVTGDLAFSGSKKDYTGRELSVEKFLDQLLEEAGLGKGRLYTVPGNHDVERDSIGTPAAKDESRLEDHSSESLCKEIIDRVFPTKDKNFDRDLLLNRHQAYSQFCRRYFGEERYPGLKKRKLGKILPVLAYTAKPEIPGCGQTFGLAGLCTSFISQSRYCSQEDDDRQGSQFVCVKTVEDAAKALKDEPFRIALMHHPPEWLLAPERDRLGRAGYLFSEFDLILTGHVHKKEPLWNPPQHGQRAIRCSAG